MGVLGLRKNADLRTLAWLFFLVPVPMVAQYAAAAPAPWMDAVDGKAWWWPAVWAWPLCVYTSFVVGVMAHNINHLPPFKFGERGNPFCALANTLIGMYVSIWYGFPIFAWVPTHNENHHKRLNRKGDATITWRLSKKNNIFNAFFYPFVSTYHQSTLVSAYLAKHKAAAFGQPIPQSPTSQHHGNSMALEDVAGTSGASAEVFWNAMLQYCAGGVAHSTLAYIAIVHRCEGNVLHGLWLYLTAMLLPSLLSGYQMMFTNYIQHVHCDPWDMPNASRNFHCGDSFVAKAERFLTFNAGYHQAHHNSAHIHWSDLGEAHAKLEADMDPRLKLPSMTWFIFSTYILYGVFGFSAFKTEEVGRPAWDEAGETPAAKSSLEKAARREAAKRATCERAKVA